MSGASFPSRARAATIQHGLLVSDRTARTAAGDAVSGRARARAGRTVLALTVMRIGFHTDAFNTRRKRLFQKCLAWAQTNRCALTSSACPDSTGKPGSTGWAISRTWRCTRTRPVAAKDGCIRGAILTGGCCFSLSGEDGPLRGVPYVMKAIAWAAQIGCPCVTRPTGYTNRRVLPTRNHWP